MRKPLMLIATLLVGWALPLMVSAQGAAPPVVYHYDIDSSDYHCPVLCTPGSSSCGPDSAGLAVKRKITTSGISTTTLTSVSSDAPFRGLAVGDYISATVSAAVFSDVPATVTYQSRVSGIVSHNSITVDDAFNIPAAGVGFTWWKLSALARSNSEAGWFAYPNAPGVNVVTSFPQISDTGGVDYVIETRNLIGSVGQLPLVASGPTNIATAVAFPDNVERVNFLYEPWQQMRACFKVTTSDDDGIVITSTTDDLDWKEYINSYTVGAADDLDFTEDSGGTPKVCTIDSTAGAYTGATLAAHLTTLMNAAACTPDNTYLVSYSTSTHKFTIARATGTKTVDLLWNTGANTATSLKTLLGYANTDDTGATTYASDSATGETTFTQNLDAGTYSGADMCVEIAAEMNATASVVGVYSCAFAGTPDDTITISATGITQLMILWNSGTNNATSADTALGFSADSTGALSYTGSDLDMGAASEIEKIDVTVREIAR